MSVGDYFGDTKVKLTKDHVNEILKIVVFLSKFQNCTVFIDLYLILQWYHYAGMYTLSNNIYQNDVIGIASEIFFPNDLNTSNMNYIM